MKAIFQFAIPYGKEQQREPHHEFVLRKDLKLDVAPKVGSFVTLGLTLEQIAVTEVYFDLSGQDEAVLVVVLKKHCLVDSAEEARHLADGHGTHGWWIVSPPG